MEMAYLGDGNILVQKQSLAKQHLADLRRTGKHPSASIILGQLLERAREADREFRPIEERIDKALRKIGVNIIEVAGAYTTERDIRKLRTFQSTHCMNLMNGLLIKRKGHLPLFITGKGTWQDSLSNDLTAHFTSALSRTCRPIFLDGLGPDLRIGGGLHCMTLEQRTVI